MLAEVLLIIITEDKLNDLIMNNKIEIELSKKKIFLLFIAGIIFVILGFLGAMNPQDFVSPIFRSPEIIRIFGIAAICFFGVCIIFMFRKLFDNKLGLIIDENGITDNTNATSMGLIEWNDITMVEKKQVMSTKFLILHTNNPEKYVQRAKNFISKRAIEMNIKTYGSPISITSNSLKMSFEDLENLIIKEFKRNKLNIVGIKN